MAELSLINTKVGIGKAYYLELLEEFRLGLLDGSSTSCECEGHLSCLQMTITSLELDIAAGVNNDATTINYELLLKLIGDYDGSYVIDTNVSGGIGQTIILSGAKGDPGADGLSAYQIAVNNGFVGTQAQWLISLIGAQGPIGLDGQIIVAGDAANILSGIVPPTTEGIDDDWYIDTVESILYGPKTDGIWPSVGIVLNGLNGKSAYTIAVDNGFVGTVGEWLLSLVGEQGVQGISAYTVAVNNGFVGSESAWLASLHGTDGIDGTDAIDGIDGVDGLSAYQIAVNNGFVGTELEWLESLKGADGEGSGDFVELNRDDAFTVTDTEDIVIGTLTSDKVKILQLKSASGEVLFQVAPAPIITAIIPTDVDVVWTLNENGVDPLDLNLAFRATDGTLLSNHTTEGSGLAGDGGTKPKSGELLRAEVSYTGGVNAWDGPVKVTFEIRKNGVWFDGSVTEYPTAPAIGLLDAKSFYATEFEEWTTSAKAERYTIPEEEDETSDIDTPPVLVLTRSTVGGTDTIVDGEASTMFFADQSYDNEGHSITYRYYSASPNITFEAP